MTISKGQQAPAFTLIDSERNEVSLSDFKGKKLLILFYPGAFSGVCTDELCVVRDDMNSYSSLNINIVGISTDTVFTLKKFKEINKLEFPLLSDYNKEVCGLYGAQYDEWILGMKGPAKRSAFVIDENGTLIHSEVLESAGDLPDFNQIKSAVS